MYLSGLLFGLIVFAPSYTWAVDNCTSQKKTAVCSDEIVKERVSWACALVQEKGASAIPSIRTMRYDCCGEPDYVWLNDMHPKVVMHPVKVTMNGADVSNNRDAKGKKLFVEFVESVKKYPAGAWVDYLWTKFGETEPTPKKSWVRKCRVGKTNEYWVVGSGTWK